VRLHVRLDGKSVQAAWDDCMKHLFDYLDVNGDGVLSKDEAERAPPVNVLLGGAGGRGFGGRDRSAPVGPTMADLDTDKDGKVTREELAAYYRKQGFAPYQFQLEAAPANPLGRAAFLGGPRPEPPVEAVSKAIFQHLDTNKDGKLTKEKLAAAADVLLKLDEDEDEIVTTRELVPDSGNGAGIAAFPAMGGPNRNAATSSPAFVAILTPGEVPADFVKRMKDRYAKSDTTPAKRLSQKDLGLDDATFRQLDANNDGWLDDQEISAFVKRAPDLEYVVHLGKKEAAAANLELVKDDGRSPLAAKVTLKDGQALLDLGRTRAELRTNSEERNDRFAGFLRQQLVGQFKAADTNGDGFLDEKEATASRVFKPLFKALDRNGTGKVSEKDLIAYLEHVQELQKRAAASCVTLELSDHSRGLFDLLDTNRDGRLSVREMRQAPRLLAQLDHEGKGYITRDDVPRTYRLELHRGTGQAGFDPARAFFNRTAGGSPAADAAPARGPLWFRKMDRNRDGDVSRKEFLFGDELFREIDTDGDGLISVEEAERYDALHRKEK
jgi:Ca2+-binding EF-hand superfamily protein